MLRIGLLASLAAAAPLPTAITPGTSILDMKQNVFGTQNVGYANSGTGNIGAYNGLGNTGSTNGNDNIGALNGNFNTGSYNGNNNVGALNGNLNGGSYNGNGNIGGFNGNFNGNSMG